ncbi:MAG: HEAT repeat domain-containing protein [Myxococcales bacterium]|nr:HEAT repeat domain-containing protein [Myxococcales bacterium]
MIESNTPQRHQIRGALFLGTVLALATTFLWAPTGRAQNNDCTVHDRQRGECSVGTDAPSQQKLMNAIQSAGPTKFMATLEYGERVECDACVVPLMKRILSDDNPQVREFAAWWIRRRPFHVGYVMKEMRTVLADDKDPVRRARAAEAIGEFLDPKGVAHLADALAEDGDAPVRAAAAAALGRLNHPTSHALLAEALDDKDSTVRLAALRAVRRVNFFEEYEALIGTLADGDEAVRREGALLSGQYRVKSAVPALAGLLRSDGDSSVRRAAAWALGRVGGEDAGEALREVRDSETDKTVQDAIAVALKM